MNRIPKSTSSDDKITRISLAGCLLVAAPSVQDAVFARSVCIVVEHSEERTIGIMLNRRLAMDTELLLEQLSEGAEKSFNSVSHVNFGGPQNGPILAIHDNQMLAEGGNSQGVYLSAQSETLKKLAQTTPEHCRLFVGHAVWQVAQLETAIINGDWHVLPAVPELVFADEYTMWARGIQIVGNSIIQEATGLPHLMAQPFLN
ncbi:MAG TPA: YqgE/AlgH family protein [Pirellula sp.]|nr:YqgE/AlgH family protein [Pirellula sp.]